MKAPVFDLQPLLEAVSGDPEIMSQVISLFINSTSNDVKILREALARNDGRTVKATAHHLKGSLLEIGAKELVALALRLEQMGSSQQFADADVVWQELDAALRDLVAVLDQTEYRRTA
jgi:HPt (histidine-containing phosphotransfer) domain-containing protein